MIDPVICLTCQSKYCRKCIEKKIKENKNDMIPPDKEKEKDIDKDTKENNENNTNIITPIQDEKDSTPIGYDKALRPGEIILNFNDIPINDKVTKVENDLGEFIVDKKELKIIKLMASENM